MKVTLKRVNKYLSYLSQRLQLRFTWRRALTGTRRMMGYMLNVPIVLLGKNGRTWVLGTVAFCSFALRLKRTSGFKGLAIYLKVSSTCLIKYVAGAPVKGVASSLGHRVALTGSGIPTMINANHRKAIRRGDTRVIRFWLSLMSLYRVIDFLGKPKLSTITRPGVDLDFGRYLEFIPTFFKLMSNKGFLPEKVEVPSWEPKLITKAGPGSVSGKKQPKMHAGNTTSAMVYQAVAFHNQPALLAKFKMFATLTGQQTLSDTLSTVISYAKEIKTFRASAPLHLGKLGVKEEPGKVRVFAMVDWWTQTLLRPLHKMLFMILGKIKQDATFDQDAGVLLGVRMLNRSGFAASYDLSAATDRLPVVIQAMLVNHLLPKCGQLWAELLVGRLYSLPKKIRQIGMKLPQAVHYAVGQPMGALSSWAMLAMTHHFIVQLAAFKTGWKFWFSSYLVLGDDIVIFDRQVANQYLVEMAALGVDINLVKSVVSNDSFEFAKRFYSKGVNLSPLSFKELEVSLSSLDAMSLMLSKFQGETVRISTFARLRGYGYRSLALINKRLTSLPRHLRFLIVFLSMPGVSCVSFKSFIEWLTMTSIGRHKIRSLDSLRDHILRWWETSRPEGSTTELVARDIWGPSGILKIRDWRIEYLESTLQTLMWPQQLAYMEAHRAADKYRAEIENLSSSLQTKDELENFVSKFLDWDSENSLTPVHIDIFAHRDRDVVKPRISRWLRWWSSAQPKKHSV